jgi:hypothetical protein
VDPLRRVRECSVPLSLSPSLPSRPVPHLHPLPSPSLPLTPPSPPHPLRIRSPSPPPLAAIFLAPARCCEELLKSEPCAWKLIRTDVVRTKKN